LDLKCGLRNQKYQKRKDQVVQNIKGKAKLLLGAGALETPIGSIHLLVTKLQQQGAVESSARTATNIMTAAKCLTKLSETETENNANWLT